jgi:hypothetical protein
MKASVFSGTREQQNGVAPGQLPPSIVQVSAGELGARSMQSSNCQQKCPYGAPPRALRVKQRS